MFGVVVGFCILTFARADGLFDLDELENSQYSVSILDTPISLDQAEGDSTAENIVIMMNKFGQKYQCKLPLQANSDEAEGSSGKEPEPEINIASLIAPLHESPCLVRTKDWWTYQVCFGRDVTQYHVENDKPSGEIMSLGVFNTDRETSGDKSLSYYPELYTNGSKCDLTGRGRESELRFVCNEKAPREFIGDIFEPKSCEYTIVIHTDKICSVPQFKPATDTVPMDINCKPILKKDQMEKYERYAKLKAKKLQLKRMKVKKEQEQFLKLLTEGSNPLKSLPGFGEDNINKLVKELGAFMETGLDKSSDKPEIRVINMEGSMPKSIPNKKAVIEDTKEVKKEEGWNIIHESHESDAMLILQDKVEQLEGRLLAKVNYVSHNLNTRLLSIYQSTERAEADEDLAKTVLLRNEKEMLEKNKKEAEQEIQKIEIELNKVKGLLFEQQLREASKDKKILKQEDAKVVKKSVTDDFPQIIKDAMNDLGIEDEELDSMDETMSAMEDELNGLLKKLQATEKETVSLKRDFKRSVKKELREDEEFDDPEKAKAIQETVNRLKVMESQLDDVEEGLKEKKGKVLKEIEKIKTSGEASIKTDDNLDSASKKLFGNLETQLKAKIEKLGLDKLNLDSPIQIKVVATNVPVGDDDMESMGKDYYEGILHNIMIGNDKGYKDIQNQFSADKNYKFSLTEEDFQKLEDDVGELEDNVGSVQPLDDVEVDDDIIDDDLDVDEDGGDLYDVEENEEEDEEDFHGSISNLVDSLLGMPEVHTRPASKHTTIHQYIDENKEDESTDEKVKDSHDEL